MFYSWCNCPLRIVSKNEILISISDPRINHSLNDIIIFYLYCWLSVLVSLLYSKMSLSAGFHIWCKHWCPKEQLFKLGCSNQGYIEIGFQSKMLLYCEITYIIFISLTLPLCSIEGYQGCHKRFSVPLYDLSVENYIILNVSFCVEHCWHFFLNEFGGGFYEFSSLQS